MAETSLQFSRPVPKEALAYFRAKDLKPGFSHLDVWREEHASSFTVAKAMNLDVLQDIRDGVDKALAEGRTFAQFKRDLQPLLEKRGWWGQRQMTDPLTGKKRLAQLGSPKRLRVIYRTNLRTARAAGQWERIQRTRKALPFLLYQLGPSREHRPEHVAFHGLLLPADDPFWLTHMPPNGWGCKCRVRQVSKVEAERLGREGVSAPTPEREVNPDTGLPTGHLKRTSLPVRTQAPKLTTREWVNKRTGEVHQVPVGCDPGWDYNPGVAGRLAKTLDHASEKLAVAERGAAASTARQLASGEAFDAWSRKPKGDFPIGVLKDEDAALLKAQARVVRLSPDTLVKQKAQHPELTSTEYGLVQDSMDSGERIQDGASSLVYILEDAGYVSVVKATRTGRALFLTSFRRLSRDEGKRDRELIRLRAKKR